MRNLAEDLDEFNEGERRARGWMRRARNKAGLEKDDASCWFAYVRNDGVNDEKLVSLGRSPADVLLDAERYAQVNFAARRTGLGRWTMEVYGDGENKPDYLIVECREDNAYYQAGE